MYLVINGNQHTVQRRVETKGMVRFYSVTPEPDNLSGEISLYRDDGFLLSADNADGFPVRSYTAEILTLAEKNAPNPPEDPQNRISRLESEKADRVDVDNMKYMDQQLQVATKLYVQKATDIPDAQALEMPDLFPTWEEVLAAGEMLAANTILSQDGQLYRVVQAVTPQENQPPNASGMLAVYRPIDQTHAGTLDDPVPYVDGMDTEEGKYYSYNGKTYLCNLTMTPCVWPPDTPGLWQWTEVTK